MNRTTMITALACGLLLTSAAAPIAGAAPSAGTTLEDGDSVGTASDTLLINGRAYPLE